MKVLLRILERVKVDCRIRAKMLLYLKLHHLKHHIPLTEQMVLVMCPL
ncbi:MAG: hypothetical protein JRD19_02195 [Deltaproteobacteria bacterium]|nr:hypothetical protein [Deltaproteobacteria bacterium]